MNPIADHRWAAPTVMRPGAVSPDPRLKGPAPALPLLGTAVALYALFFLYLKGGSGWTFFDLTFSSTETTVSI
jgi:hypothetical protein